jgi:hypothetical protein
MWQLVCGMLPTVTATVLDNNSIQNSSDTSGRNKTELDNAKNNSLTYGVGLIGPFFDGMRMFARLDQLKELQNWVKRN